MTIHYGDRSFEVDKYYWCDGKLHVETASWNDTDAALTEAEMEEVSEQCQDQIYEKMPKGTGY